MPRARAGHPGAGAFSRAADDPGNPVPPNAPGSVPSGRAAFRVRRSLTRPEKAFAPMLPLCAS